MANWQKFKKTKGFKFYGVSLLVMVLALSLVVIPALAMTTTEIVSGVQVAASSDWTVSTSAGTVSVTKSGTTTSSGCSSTDSTANSATLTITNTSGEEARLSFDYTYSAGTLYIAGTSYTAGGSYSADIAAGGTVSVYLISPSGSSSSGTSVLSNFVLTSLNATSTVTFGDGITAKIDGTTVNATESHDVAMSSSVTATASAAEDGMEFGWWAINGEFYSASTSLTWSPSSDDATEITVVYKPAGVAVFSVGTSMYYDLGDALDAGSTVTVYTSGTLYSGEGASGYDADTGETNYTIPSGKTLLVPRVSGDTGSLTAVYVSGESTPYAYRTLTLSANTTIDVKGTLIANAQQFGTSTNNTGKPNGGYGAIVLEEDAEINVSSGATFNAYGYITGDGKVTAQSGATVKELLEITDYRGGSSTYSTYSKDVFAVTQYFIQNIQTEYWIYSGATLTGNYAVSTSSGGNIANGAATVISEDSTNSMFRLTDGYIIRTYTQANGTTSSTYTEGDVIRMELHGTMETGTFKVGLSSTLSSVSVSSSGKELPISGNMNLAIADGSTFDMDDGYKLLPGAKLIVDEGGTLNLNSGGSLYIYSNDDYLSTYGYTYGTHAKVTGMATGLWWPGDAEIIVNGVMNVAGNTFYESISGGVISGTGIINYTSATSSSTSSILEVAGAATSTTSVTFYKVTLDGAGATGVAAYQGTEGGTWYNTNGTVSVVENTTTSVEDNQFAVDVVITPEYDVSNAEFEVAIAYDADDISKVKGETSYFKTNLTLTADGDYTLGTIVFEVLDTCGATIEVSVDGDGTWTLGGYSFTTSDATSYIYYPTLTITYDQTVQAGWVTGYTAEDLPVTLPTLGADDDGDAFWGWSDGTDVITEITADNAGNLTLSAKWLTTLDAPTYADKETAYTGTSISHEIAEDDLPTGIDKVTYSYEGTDYDKTSKAPTDAGTYTVTASFTMLEGYTQLDAITATLTIVQSEVDFGDAGIVVDGVEADDADMTYTYGETVTITVTPEATGEAAADTEDTEDADLTPAANGIALTALYEIEPEAGEMALYATIDGEETQISDPATADDDGMYKLTYDTTDKLLAVGTHAITVKYVGTENMADYSEIINVQIEAKSITATVDEEDGSATKEYDGTTAFEAVALTVSANKIVGDDRVSATADGTSDTANVTSATDFSATSTTLSGDDAGFYALASGDVSGDVAITACDVTETGYTDTATVVEGNVVFNEPSFDGVSEVLAGTVTYTYDDDAVEYAALVEALNELDYQEDTEIGVAYTFTPSDDNYTGTITGTLTLTVTVVEPVYTVNSNTITASYDGDVAGTVSISAPTENLVYGDTTPVASVAKTGIFEDETFTITYTKDGETVTPRDAGTYIASVTVGGKTAEVSFTISRASATFSISDNSFEFGTTPAVAVTSDDGLSASDYTVTYLDSTGAEVALSSETPVGVYTVQITVTNANYKLSGSVDSVVVYEETIPTSNLSYELDGGEGASDESDVVVGTITTLPTPTKTGYTFTGWSYDGKLYAAGAAFVQPEEDVTMSANWVENTFTVSGTVTDKSGDYVEDAVVTLGDTTVQTDSDGYYAFTNVAMGGYDISATNDTVTTTTYIL